MNNIYHNTDHNNQIEIDWKYRTANHVYCHHSNTMYDPSGWEVCITIPDAVLEEECDALLEKINKMIEEMANIRSDWNGQNHIPMFGEWDKETPKEIYEIIENYEWTNIETWNAGDYWDWGTSINEETGEVYIDLGEVTHTITKENLDDKITVLEDSITEPTICVHSTEEWLTDLLEYYDIED